MKKVKLLMRVLTIAGLTWIFAAATRKKQPPAANPVEKENRQSDYRGNPGSRVFHLAACKYYDAAGCVESFSSREEAIRAEFRPCTLCSP